MVKYRRLVRTERYQIQALLRSGLSLRDVGKNLGRSPSTISRELQRNTIESKYFASKATVLSEQRKCREYLDRKLIQGELERIVREKIKQDWSPEQIVGRLKRNGSKYSLSFSSIYRYIYARALRGDDLYLHLRRRHRRRVEQKKAKKYVYYRPIENRIGIKERPAVVLKRNRIGDFERDTLLGKFNGASILSIVDRTSRLTKLSKLEKKIAIEAHRKTVFLLKGLGVKTITNDNGNEFKFHTMTTEELKVPVYFSNPYSPWERGTNENTNGLLRQYFPRYKDIGRFTEDEIKAVEEKLNNRPRKCLAFKTPLEVHKLKRSDVALAG